MIAEPRKGLTYEEYYETDKWKWTWVAGIVTSQLTHHEGEETHVKVTINPDMKSLHCRIESPTTYSSYYWRRNGAHWSAPSRAYGIQRRVPEVGTKHLDHLTSPERLWERV